jgi:hypothetical protein
MPSRPPEAVAVPKPIRNPDKHHRGPRTRSPSGISVRRSSRTGPPARHAAVLSPTRATVLFDQKTQLVEISHDETSDDMFPNASDV